jgi:monofunctional glycosyltransferase
MKRRRRLRPCPTLRTFTRHTLARRADLRQVCEMARRRSFFSILGRGIVLIGLVLVCIFIGLVALYSFAPPVSTLMLARKIEDKSYQRIYVRLADIASVAVASVMASEDAGFCQNDGVDRQALHEAVRGAGKDGPSRGASTITMQTAKNLFRGQAVLSFARASRSASR